jgi:hypothetical protein
MICGKNVLNLIRYKNFTLPKVKILVVFSVISFFWCSLVSAQNISYVSLIQNNRVTAYNSASQEISYKYLTGGDELAGFSTTLIVIKSTNGRVTVYDQKFNAISYKYINSNDYVKAINGDYIIIKNSNRRVTIYDKNFYEVSYRYENY